MKKILHVIATPRKEVSRTIRVSQTFLDAITEKHEWAVEEIDLFSCDLPPFSGERVGGKYALMQGGTLPSSLTHEWQPILSLIEQFLSVDAYVFSVPMWNFGVPYVLKQYFDVIVQPQYLFQYGPEGVEGLVTGKKAVIITSRGGDYRAAPMAVLDQQVPYLETILGFIGVDDRTFIHAQPMDAGGVAVGEKSIAEAQVRAVACAAVF